MSYSYQFRLKIIKLVTEQGYGIREVAKLQKLQTFHLKRLKSYNESSPWLVRRLLT